MVKKWLNCGYPTMGKGLYCQNHPHSFQTRSILAWSVFLNVRNWSEPGAKYNRKSIKALWYRSTSPSQRWGMSLQPNTCWPWTIMGNPYEALPWKLLVISCFNHYPLGVRSRLRGRLLDSFEKRADKPGYKNTIPHFDIQQRETWLDLSIYRHKPFWSLLSACRSSCFP